MICKIPDKRADGESSFRSLVTYMATSKRVDGTIDDDRVFYSGLRNMPELDMLREFGVREIELRDIYETMWFSSLNNKNVTDPVVHAILSFREGEIPTEDQCREAVTIWLKEQGLSECQTYWTVHANTDNYHIHICCNRVDPISHVPVHLAFYKKANERASRKIELAQGWELETTGHLAEVKREKNGKIRVKDKSKKARSEDRALSGKARDYENRTGLKSVERIAKEIAVPILLSAQSWPELHSQLAEIGIELRQKGSGGILVIGDTEVKLSSASSKCSWAKMAKRLGAFFEREPNIKPKDFIPQPLDVPGQESNLATYHKQKSDYYAAKESAKKALDAWIAQKRSNFDKSKKQRRKALYASRSWKGHGKELNAQRSKLAHKFASEKEQLDAEITARREEYEKLFDKTKEKKWSTYEQWLREQGLNDDAEIWRYRNATALILGATVVYAQIDVERYRPEVSGGLVKYLDEHGKTAFVDRGQHILVKQSDNEAAIRASLQVAVAKWGVIRLFGSKEFVERSLRIAAELGIRLSDPEQQRRAEEIRKELRNANTYPKLGTARVDQRVAERDRETDIRELTAERTDRESDLETLLARDSTVRSAAKLAELERANREAEQERLRAEKSRRAREERRADEDRRREEAERRRRAEAADRSAKQESHSKGHGSNEV